MKKLDLQYPPEVFRTLRFRFLTPPPSYIRLEEATGKIYTSGRIDRDAICRTEEICKLEQDLAVQPVQYFQIIKISIEILDINDNRPDFVPRQVVQELVESVPVGTTFVIPTARDIDTRPKSVQKYVIEFDDPADDKMELKIVRKLDGSTEVRLVLARPLDRESRDLHRIKVVAFDGGTPPRNGTLDVSVVVMDANDNLPIFEFHSYEVKVKENERHMTTIARVIAHDNDIGLNGQVLYGFSASTRTTYGDVFAINNRTGEIYVIGPVDHETNPVCHLIVTAVDLGPNSLPSEATVVVRVEDVNDNAPKVSSIRPRL